MKHEQIVNRKDHPIYSCHRRNFASITPIAPETIYSVTAWLSVVGFIIIIALICGVVPLMVGCDDTDPPTDLVDSSDVTTEFVGETVDTTETTDTANVDMVEDEVVVSPCADYGWLNNNFWCCPGGGRCEWNTCSTSEVDGQCLVFCEKTLNNKPVDYPLAVFSPPDSFSVNYSSGDSVDCRL